MDGKRVHTVKLNSSPPTYKNVNFFVGRYYGNEKHVADTDLRNIVYKTDCA